MINAKFLKTLALGSMKLYF